MSCPDVPDYPEDYDLDDEVEDHLALQEHLRDRADDDRSQALKDLMDWLGHQP